MNFYSASLSLVILIDDSRPRKSHLWDDIVIVFRARDFEHAFARALHIGRSHETEYVNFQKQKVRWALVKVETLDFVGKRVDGSEVASRLRRRRSSDTISFETVFRPEESKPTQSF